MPPGGPLAEVVVEGDHAMKLGARDVQRVTDRPVRFARDVAILRLERMEDRQKRPLEPLVARDQGADLSGIGGGAGLAGGHRRAPGVVRAQP
jgi:hypothetical protein